MTLCLLRFSSPYLLFSSQVRALYDFTGEQNTSELSITAGELLTVIRDNVGDGWCEGFNQSGKSGLFPAAYVQVVDQAAPSSSTWGGYFNLRRIYVYIERYLVLRYLSSLYVNAIRSSDKR